VSERFHRVGAGKGRVARAMQRCVPQLGVVERAQGLEELTSTKEKTATGEDLRGGKSGVERPIEAAFTEDQLCRLPTPETSEGRGHLDRQDSALLQRVPPTVQKAESLPVGDDHPLVVGLIEADVSEILRPALAVVPVA